MSELSECRFDKMELIRVENNSALVNEDITRVIADFEDKIKDLKAKEEKLKTLILTEMEEKGVLKLEDDFLTIAYIAPTDREQFDVKRFKTDNAELYDKYCEIKPIKSSVRIRVK